MPSKTDAWHINQYVVFREIYWDISCGKTWHNIGWGTVIQAWAKIFNFIVIRMCK